MQGEIDRLLRWIFFVVKDDSPDGGSEDEVLLGSQITGYNAP